MNNLYMEWLVEKALLMLGRGFAEYPVTSDAALFVLDPSGPKPVEYAKLVSYLETLTARNDKDDNGFTLIEIGLPDGKTAEVSLDFSDKARRFRLVNSKIPP